MPRPTDHYTHSQFEITDSDFQGETVRCVHCKQWTGSVKTLNRKKDHLHKCPAYAAWREAGNGQDIPPPNRYSKRDGQIMTDVDPYSSPYAEMYGNSQSQFTPTGALRNKTFDMTPFFDEFWDDQSDQKCMRTRCRHCGYVRAKNTTRQFEHLQQCRDFLQSSEGQQALADGSLNVQPASSDYPARGDFIRGRGPNPNFSVARQNGKPRPSGSKVIQTPNRPAAPTPSLVNHLLVKHRALVEQASQLQFLSHAGCGTLSVSTLQQWLAQQSHMSRSLCTFIGSLIGKIRLTDTQNPTQDSSWRTLDLLVSTVNNAKRELEFIRTTQAKYGLQNDSDSLKPATKGIIDLMAGVSSPAASLLEGMVVLWAVEYLYNVSWQYAANFVQPGPPSSTPYSLPTYLQGSQYGSTDPFDNSQPGGSSGSNHTAALHEALIPNWTSQGFGKFVEACKSIVDELANAQTSGNGAAELGNCETNFKQVAWLWKQMWPEVNGMGEESGVAAEADEAAQTNGNADDDPIEIPDDDETNRDDDAPEADSPYGGTNLGAVAAANRAS